MKLFQSENKKIVDEIKKQQEVISKLVSLPKNTVQKMKNDTLFASLQSTTGIQAEQLDVLMANNLETERYAMMLEKDNLRLISLLRGYGYEESSSQREILLADYTPVFQQKFQRQLDVMLMLNGFQKEEENLMSNYIEGNISRSTLEKNMKKFIINNPINNKSFTSSLLDSQPSEPEIPHPVTTHTCVNNHPHSGPCTLTVINPDPPSTTKTSPDIRYFETPSTELGTKL